MYTYSVRHAQQLLRAHLREVNTANEAVHTNVGFGSGSTTGKQCIVEKYSVLLCWVA